MVASGAVAFGIVSLLPVELILQVSAGAGFAMVFALLIAAIILESGAPGISAFPLQVLTPLIGSVDRGGAHESIDGRERRGYEGGTRQALNIENPS